MEASNTLSTQNSTSLMLFYTYGKSGFTLNLAIPAILIYVIAIFGVIMNAFVVYITVKYGKLRSGTANYLMALLCCCEILHQSGHTLFFIVMISGKNFVGLLTAQLILIPQLIGVNGTMMAMLCAASDRLFAVASPHRYKKVTLQYKRAYLAVYTVICMLFSLYSFYYVIFSGSRNAENPTTGCICDILSDNDAVRTQFFVLCTLINLACVACYLLIWALIRRQNGVTKETNTRLLRSLVVILCVSIGGYLINLTVYQLVYTFRDQLGNPIRIWQLAFIAAILLNMAAASNCLILYRNSTEYRKVIRQELKELAEMCGAISGAQSNSTASVHYINSPQHQSRHSIAVARF